MGKILHFVDNQVVKMGVNVRAVIRDAKTGKVKREYFYHNIIPTVGRAAIANALSDSTPSPANLRVNYVALGTGVNVPANADTKLQTETYRNTVASQTNANNVCYQTGFFNATECNGTYKEAGLFIEGTGVADSGTLLSRVAINITKAVTETLTLDWTITIS